MSDTRQPIDTTTPLSISGPPPKPPAPAGLQQFVCVYAEDLGVSVSDYPGSPPRLQPKVLLGFELAEKMDDGRPWMLSKEYTASTFKMSTLTKHLEAWRGRPFTETERNNFNLRSLIGVNGMVNVIHKPRVAGGFRADIASLSPLMKGLAPIKPENTTLPPWIEERREKNKAGVARFMAADDRYDARAEQDVVERPAKSGFDEVPY